MLAGLAVLTIAALLYYRFRKSPFQWDVFLSTFQAVDGLWLSVAILLMLLTYLGRALRWQVMLRPLLAHPNLWHINVATIIGFTAVFLLGRPGELVRPYLISIKERVTFSSQMAAWLLERILDLLLVLLIFGYSLTRIPPNNLQGASLRWVLHAGGYMVAGTGAVCVLVLIAFRSFSELAQRRVMSALTFLPIHLQKRVATTIAAFAEGMRVTRNPKNLTLLCLYTVLEWAIILAGLYSTFRAFPVTSRLTATDVMIFAGFVSFGSIIQIPGIGGGVQVVGIMVFTEILGLQLESATGMALLIWLLSFVLIVPLGVFFAFREGIKWRKLKDDVPILRV